MNTHKILYYTFALIMGIGWFWALSPHAFHDHTTMSMSPSLQLLASTTLSHVLWGAIIALIGLVGMLFTAKKA